ncbi:MAG: cell wall metabolism sensor histidine kinase WalK [Phycisphaerae bacterium]|nr:cell wall metabolism sensor histidine kinase WalK [Phycisphaerae bacterium]MDW8260927.1 ATP-binding protein [Phycisphaerales bacterium]
MTRLRSLPIFIICLVAGGLAVLASVAGVLYRTRPDAYVLTVTSAVLFILAAAAGVMAGTVLRTNCRKMAVQLCRQISEGHLSKFSLNHVELRPLVGAINDLVDFTNQQLEASKLKLKELEIQLKVANAERQRAQAIIKSISDAVLVTDRFDDLVLANESAARALDFKVQSPDRLPVDKVLSDAKVIELIREMRQSRSVNSRRVIEHTIRQGNAERTYKVTLSCVSDEQGETGEREPAGVVCVLHDMTREKEIAAMKNDFVSHVSHELRTPLASIRAYVEMLVDGEATDEKTRREFYEIIQAEANRLGRLIDNILNISRIESGLVKVNRRPLSLSVVMKEAIEVIAPQARMKGIEIEERVPPAFYETLADKDMIYQAILNLLSNSIKYTPEGGKLTVETIVNEADRKVTARITDTGVGIPAQDLPYVFEKFYRVEANSKMAKGTGLGLSLVKHIIENVHHGRVFVTSEVGKGSTFGFELDLI